MKRKLQSLALQVGITVGLAVLLAACSTPTEPTPTPGPSTDVAAPVSPTGKLFVKVVSVDVGVGRNRMIFGVLDADGNPLKVPEVDVDFIYFDGPRVQTRAETTAAFNQWPESKAGVYVTGVTLNETGNWGAMVSYKDQEGKEFVGQTAFLVPAKSSTPAVDDRAPKSEHRIAGDVDDLSELTSDPDPDPDLYQITLKDAIEGKLVTVVTFASPAFCQTATCLPQVKVLSAVKEKHKGEANFIHIETYENPKEMAGDRSLGRLSPVVIEWGIFSEPFTFVIKRNGLIHSKFEGFVTEEELESALDRALRFRK